MHVSYNEWILLTYLKVGNILEFNAKRKSYCFINYLECFGLKSVPQPTLLVSTFVFTLQTQFEVEDVLLLPFLQDFIPFFGVSVEEASKVLYKREMSQSEIYI